MTGTQSEDRYLVEHEGRPLGMIVGEPYGYVVYACAKQVWSLDRKVFPSLDAATRQITQCAWGTKAKG